jgi:hypothetical protein
MIPVAAMTTFLPTVVARKPGSRDMNSPEPLEADEVVRARISGRY